MENQSKEIKAKKYIVASILCGLICAIFTVFIHLSFDFVLPGTVNKIENVWLDNLFNFRQEHFANVTAKASDDIILVLFNDATDKKLNKFWPYERSESAKIIEYLKFAGAKAVLFDIMYQFPKTKTDEEIQNDKFLVRATEESDNTYIGVKYIHKQKNFKVDKDQLNKFNIKINISGKNKSLQDFDFTNNSKIITPPFPALFKAVKGIGFLNSNQDTDGVKRTNDLIFCSDNSCYPSLSLAFFKDYLGADTITLKPGKYYEIKGIKIPVNQKNQVFVNWLGGLEDIIDISKQIAQLRKDESEEGKKKLEELEALKKKKTEFVYSKKSAWKLILDHKTITDYMKEHNISAEKISKYFDKLPLYMDPSTFNNKIAIVGVTAKSAEDFVGSPYGRIPGVFNHAFVLDSFLNKNFIYPINSIIALILLTIFCVLSSVTVFWSSSRDSLLTVILPIVYLLLFAFLSIFLFGQFNILVNVFDPFLGILVSAFGAVTLYFMLEGKSKKQIKAAMTNYLSPQVLKAVLDDPSKLGAASSRRKKLTILFSDIRGFTTFSENNPAELVVRMLNEYLFAMTDIIFRYNGTLDKFIGDAIMAFWGAPIDAEEHALLAVKTAIAMKEKVDELNAIWSKVYKHSVHIGIGINTDEVVVGNIGSEKFMDYTVIGDGVNLASRLEGLNKNYKTTIIISENTYELVKEFVEVRYLEKVKVKGKAEETGIYELISLVQEEYDDYDDYDIYD